MVVGHPEARPRQPPPTSIVGAAIWTVGQVLLGCSTITTAVSWKPAGDPRAPGPDAVIRYHDHFFPVAPESLDGIDVEAVARTWTPSIRCCSVSTPPLVLAPRRKAELPPVLHHRYAGRPSCRAGPGARRQSPVGVRPGHQTGSVSGLVDHVDGLRLRRRISKAAGRCAERLRGGRKILEQDGASRSFQWGDGYDFMAQVDGLLSTDRTKRR